MFSVSLSPRLIVPRLADGGVYIASESSFYKILKEEKLLAHRGKSKPKTYKRPEAIVAESPNQVWSWDITYLRASIKGCFFYLYMFMDIFSRKIVGYDVYETESMELSSELIERICRAHNISRGSLILHADNGGPMRGATMLATLQKLEVLPSFSRPRVSDDNPYPESLFKTLKYCPMYPNIFNSIEEARAWVQAFINWYNNREHSGINYVTPEERHQGLDKAILEGRKSVYKLAKAKNPNRWSQNKTRNWSYADKVYLNPCKGGKENAKQIAS